MSLTPGQKLAHYQILEPIGKGGMGEVYLARDAELGRQVAIKVLPESLAGDEERVSRFRREARVLAHLNHPNVATIHGIQESSDPPFIVMELVEGETLAELIARGPIPTGEAIPLFVQIAEGLEAAHEKGTIHRDLKPANVKITPEGKVKVLDFGLAKALAPEADASAETSQSPTLTKGTALGVILGTASYMSPEQARGKRVDRRTDVWAFGACLYEALAGRKAFSADNVTDTLAAVVRAAPDWAALPGETPDWMRDLVERCLRKDPRRRLQDIGDARIALEEGRNRTERSIPSRGRPRWPALVAVAVLAACFTWLAARPSEQEPEVTRSFLRLEPGTSLARAVTTSVAISPDGRTVAYVAEREDVSALYLQSLDELEPRRIAGTEAAITPFFSPDGNWVGIHVRPALLSVPVSGGAPSSIIQLAPNVRGASWGEDGKVVLTLANTGGLSAVDVETGDIETLSTTDRDRREKTHRLPDVLPGSDGVLFTHGTGDIESWDEASIAVFSREAGDYEILVQGGSSPRYSPSGHLLYARNGAILAVPFELEKKKVRGTPVTVVHDVATSPTYGNAEFAISREGTLVYARGGSWGNSHRIVWVDREGRAEALIETQRAYAEVAISPEERTLAVTIEGANPSIWLYDMTRETMSRLAAGFDNDYALWTPDGTRVTFRSNRTGDYDLYWQLADGSGEAERLVEAAFESAPGSWTPDGRTLVYWEAEKDRPPDISAFELGVGTRRKLLAAGFGERKPVLSPDGGWLAYESWESGRSEIFLTTFPGARRKWQVSTDGGTNPRWSRSGRELFYLRNDELLAVSIDSDGDPPLGRPELLFERTYPRGTTYDVAGDGRFLFIEEVSSEPPPTELVIVQNFFAELERLVPTND